MKKNNVHLKFSIAAWLTASCLLIHLPAMADQVCRHKGEVVDLNDRDVKVFIEGEVRCVRTHGTSKTEERLVLSKGKTLERELSAANRHELRRYKIINGNERNHGEQVDYYPGTGKIKRKWKEIDGFPIGLDETFFESGKTKSKSLYFKESDKPGAALQTSAIEYHENGKLALLRCGTSSANSVDPALCGFSGASDVVLYDSQGGIRSKMKIKNGVTEEKEETLSHASSRSQRSQFNTENPAKVQTKLGKNGESLVTEFYKNGQMRWRYALDSKGQRTGSDEEWYQDGKKARVTQFATKAEVSSPMAVKTTCWWQNGQLMSESELLSAKDFSVKVKAYWDNGKPQSDGTYKINPTYGDFASALMLEDCRGRFGLTPMSPIKTYSEGGVIQAESTYQDGRVTKRIFYKEDGTQDRVEEYFPDGSKKP